MKAKDYLCFVLLSVLLCVSISNVTNASLPRNFQQVSENEYLELYINNRTTEIALRVKESGTLWYSNPINRAREETIARGAAKDALGAQIAISYFTPGDRLRYMDNYNDSIAHEQYEVSKIDNGVRVDYMLGVRWQEDSYLPVMVRGDRFENLIVDQIPNARDRRTMTDNYIKIGLEEIPDGYKRLPLSRIEKEDIFGNYTIVPIDDTWNDRRKGEVIGLFIDHFIKNREDVSGRGELKQEHIATLIEELKLAPIYILKDRLARWDIEDMVKLIKTTEYTPEEVAVDHSRYGLDAPRPNERVFEMPIEYRLEGKSLTVTIPSNEIVYPSTFPIVSVSMLPYFGAANQEQEGYMFVPDGTGALIYLNSGKQTTPSYDQPIYGRDFSTMLREELPRFTEQIHLPVFGMKQGDAGFFAIVEDGASLGRIRADLAGRTLSYNTIHSDFIPIPRGETALQGNTRISMWQAAGNTINIYQSRSYQGDFTVRYSFLDGDEANYVGMARLYQDYLVNKHDLTRLSSDKDIPFYLEVIGGISRTRPVLGMPREVVEPLTTYQEVINVVDDLEQLGIFNLNVRYTGWLRWGVHHILPTGMRLEPALGNQRTFREMLNQLGNRDVPIYLDVNFMQVYRSQFMDGFLPRRDAARFLNRKIARVPNYDLAGYNQLGSGTYIYSPNRVSSLINAFLDQYQQYPVSGLALRDMGFQVNSDFREEQDRLVDRQQAMGILDQELAKLTKQEIGVLVDKANDFVIPYAQHILNVPTRSSGFNITDIDIPFYQMVLHGYVNFASEPLNLASDFQQTVLRSMETGSKFYYTAAYRDASIVKDSNFNYLLAIDYRGWADQALGLYQEANHIFRDLQGQIIVDHQQLADNVTKTIWEQGTEIIVNYNLYPVEIEGITVPGQEYVVSREGGIYGYE